MDYDVIKFKKFWDFFCTIEKKILDNPNDISIINKLDDEVDKLGDIDWEYGPHFNNSSFYFCLSPNLHHELVDYTRQIASYAPKLDGWVFIVGKPQKLSEIDEFYILDQNQNELLIVTKNWQFVLYKFKDKDNTYDIDIKFNQNLYELDANLIVDIALTNALGEIRYMDKIANVSIVEFFDNNVNPEGIEFKYLNELII